LTALMAEGNPPAWTSRRPRTSAQGELFARVLAALKREEEKAMDAYRFGRKIKLPATVAIKHELRMMMAQDIDKAELETVRKSSEEKLDPEV
jgi:hypothetical protein